MTALTIVPEMPTFYHSDIILLSHPTSLIRRYDIETAYSWFSHRTFRSSFSSDDSKGIF